ncbi:MAG: hypothetical protein AVDCRST_MAG27-2011 [uncultured Craurococcus sp.]|uniref:Uncharacterized protein n=1 Tax=uncultured Craurococcus sp. TaxID=1135998 RepID=A0A6J4IEJ5_9PROT|nr:MAG: hypothetical protein AVDCRST_MAG27-2011 [uncultured Craurococcus sp.]
MGGDARGLPSTAPRDGILGRPTLAEGVNMLFGNLTPPAA